MPNQHPSPVKHRATDVAEKLARRDHIVEATARLYARSQTLPGVAEVAAEAGLAKGTMYLYFDTKEALYLAVHERHTRDFFVALNARLAMAQPFDFNAMAALMDEHMIANASFLPLGNACLSAPFDHVPLPVHQAFEANLMRWMTQAGQGLEQRFHALQPGDGVRLLTHGYALMLGMHQLMGAGPRVADASFRCTLPGVGGFRNEAMAALQSYWSMAVTQGLAPLPTAPPAASPPRSPTRTPARRSPRKKTP